MDKSILLKRFNETAEEFCKDLVVTFPDVKEFKQMKSGLMLLKNINEKQPRDLFNKYVSDNFRQQIIETDESFFLTEIHTHNVVGGENSQWQSVISLLRSLWGNLTDDNKQAIWKYFQVLIALNDRYLA
jgi:uncharacterized protein YbbC (DUF1343 family)